MNVVAMIVVVVVIQLSTLRLKSYLSNTLTGMIELRVPEDFALDTLLSIQELHEAMVCNVC
jgi:hypothetical protein